jgi:epsilon-lactone hydrolase
MRMRLAMARRVVRHVVRPGLAADRPLAERRRRAEWSGAWLPLPPGVRREAAGDENPGGEWLLPGDVPPEDWRGAVLYIHGGGFMLGSPSSHKAVAAQVARLTGLPVLLARYRLAPEHPWPAALEDLHHAWARITSGGTRPVALAGDSAGGWLALALALALAARADDASLARPASMALFSPLVDLAEAESKALESRESDLMLPDSFVIEGVRAWRGDLPADDPRLDLLGGELAALPPLYISFDRHEMLAEGARRLADAAQAAGIEVHVQEATGLWHAWPLFAGVLPEGVATLRQAAAVLAPAAGSTG